MDEKLLQIEDRFEKLSARMEDPDTYADPTLYADLASSASLHRWWTPGGR